MLCGLLIVCCCTYYIKIKGVLRESDHRSQIVLFLNSQKNKRHTAQCASCSDLLIYFDSCLNFDQSCTQDICSRNSRILLEDSANQFI